MDYENLGNTGLKVSRICLGTGFRGARDDALCRATIARAADLGINFIDVANVYGRGRSERIVGEVLKGRRDQFVVTSKVGSSVGPDPNDRGLSRVHIMREVERSLSQLRTDYLDVYLVHHVDPTTPIEETLRALDDLVHQGKVRYIGCCNFAAWQVCKALWVSDRLSATSFVCVQNFYNLLDRSEERELMPFCRSEELGMMVYSPLAVGLLTGRFRHGQPPPKDTPWGRGRSGFENIMSPAADRVVETLDRIGNERGKTIAQVTLAWVLSHPEVSTAIIGPDRPEHVEENIGGADWILSSEDRAALDDVSAWATNETKR